MGPGTRTVYGIVMKHHGWIDVSREQGNGTTFRIYFPEPPPGAEIAMPSAPLYPPRSAVTILLVEDQAAVRLLAEDVLTEAGHRVLSAPNGYAALKLVEQHAGHIDLLITGVLMPEMKGPELADHLSHMLPGLTVLYVSGNADHAAVQRGVLGRGTAFLQKPFLPETLRLKVEELLQNRGDQANA
jgi:two-component system cell cycle sensor histidine kinase/response regulator CckA